MIQRLSSNILLYFSTKYLKRSIAWQYPSGTAAEAESSNATPQRKHNHKFHTVSRTSIVILASLPPLCIFLPGLNISTIDNTFRTNDMSKNVLSIYSHQRVLLHTAYWGCETTSHHTCILKFRGSCSYW